jgi:hypothetical protein
MATVFWDRKGVLMVEFTQQGTTITSQVYCKTLKKKKKKLRRAGHQNKMRGMLTPGVEPSTIIRGRIEMLALEHCWSISTGSCLTTLLTGLISLRVTTTYSPTWRTGWDHGVSKIMSWWKVSKSGWTHRRHFFDKIYKKCFPIKASASVTTATIPKSSLCMHCLYTIDFVSLLLLLWAHRRSLSRISLAYYTVTVVKNHIYTRLWRGVFPFCFKTYAILLTPNSSGGIATG